MKFKEQLTAKGFTEEQIQAVSEAIKGEFIPKSRFDEVNEENKALKGTIGERDKQLDELKKTSGDNETLKKSIEKLQADNKALSEQHAKEMRELKIDNAVKTALTAAGAKNLKAVTALLTIDEKTELAEDGTIKGLAEQIKALAKSDGYLFESAPKLTGLKPGESGDGLPGGTDTSKMTYSEMLAYLEKNPNAADFL
ncbi:MAG: phage scaffolding protein [Firmicutes bacterium]|nr:phage scaffolding protein [Bacillota bacterium]